MAVRTPTGTREEPVRADRRRQAVLSPAQATELARNGLRVETLFGQSACLDPYACALVRSSAVV